MQGCPAKVPSQPPAASSAARGLGGGGAAFLFRLSRRNRPACLKSSSQLLQKTDTDNNIASV